MYLFAYSLGSFLKCQYCFVAFERRMGQKTVLLAYLGKHITVLAPKESVFDDAKDISAPRLHDDLAN